MIIQEGQIIRFLGHKWIVEGPSELGDEYIQLRRKSFISDLRKGQVATVIDASLRDLKKSVKL